MESGKVTPSQYLIMSFDSPDLNIARNNISCMIVNASRLYMTYGPYMYFGDKSRDQLIERNVTENPVESLDACVGLVDEALK